MIAALSFLAIGCGKDEMLPDETEVEFDSSKSVLLLDGDFEDVVHVVTGKVSIYDNKGDRMLVLDPFTTEAGPDLKVYLSTDDKASEFVNLGNLMSNSGKQYYPIGTSVVLSKYKYVHIWCQDFSVNFGQAALKEN